MHYIAWTIIAMIGYAIMMILLKYALRDIPPEAAVFVTNTFLVVAALGWAFYRGVRITDHVAWNQPTLFLALSGVALSVGIISLYMALSRGPVSTVSPLFGMNIALVAALGLIVLREPVSWERVMGILLAGGAVFLLAK